MDRLKYWLTDIWSGIVSFFCWFTPEHCDRISNILGMFTNFLGVLIALPTLLFITLPKVKKSTLFKSLFGKE